MHREPRLIRLEGAGVRQTLRLPPSWRLFQWASTGAASMGYSYSAAVTGPAIILPAAGVSPMLVAPGEEAFLTFEGAAGVLVLVFGVPFGQEVSDG